MLRTTPKRIPRQNTSFLIRKSHSIAKTITVLPSPLHTSKILDASGKPETPQPIKNKKTVADLDEELRRRMAGLSGGGGEAGVEYEDGSPVAMKRSVKNNMFRLI